MDKLDANQLAEWEAFDKIDPIDSQWREDYRMAKLTALIQNIVILMGSKKGDNPKLVKPVDEMPDWTGDKQKELDEPMSVEDMKAALLSIATHQNRQVKRLEKLNQKVGPPKKKK